MPPRSDGARVELCSPLAQLEAALAERKSHHGQPDEGEHEPDQHHDTDQGDLELSLDQRASAGTYLSAVQSHPSTDAGPVLA